MSSGDELFPNIDPEAEYISATTNSSSSLTLLGLKPFTSYDCFVTANTSAGESDFSIAVSVITAESGETVVLDSIHMLLLQCIILCVT